jgi:hypothetical protein
MTHYKPQSVERTALPDAVDALGVDGDGRTHFATPATHGPISIYVESSEGFDVFELAETPCDGLEDWIDHVGTLRGWNELTYTETFGEQLADTLGRAV